MANVTEEQILEELRELEPEKWFEVSDFIGYLKYRESRKPAADELHPFTALDLLQSELVGLWADRDDMDDSLTFARQLRQRAERRS
ncbi:MAG: hypothetical protein L0332_27785 [Chloroflexi bacterium]|nr:hypothetical protein [Chloroflexota bacterium]MCI0577709.1 hypothetical protein [Chloroflexota bacterium]MCI0649792.1 hypothetical protein [Chloroflexota bacterium]MCI0730501.1 hypothetical protein [Chloroflexota bacterium]